MLTHRTRIYIKHTIYTVVSNLKHALYESKFPSVCLLRRLSRKRNAKKRKRSLNYKLAILLVAAPRAAFSPRSRGGPKRERYALRTQKQVSRLRKRARYIIEREYHVNIRPFGAEF